LSWGTLKDHAATRDTRPFFLMASFPDPHHPFTPPGWDVYRPEQMPKPAAFTVNIGNRRRMPRH
jgi:hypothetical protein